jgi:hypothetical protein
MFRRVDAVVHAVPLTIGPRHLHDLKFAFAFTPLYAFTVQPILELGQHAFV